MSDRTTGYELLEDIIALELETIDTKVGSLDGEIVHVKMILQDDPDVLDSCAWGLIFAIGVLSFADARPRGISDIDFIEDDEWQVGDMLKHLRFEHGRLHFYADYVRGRCVKTSVDIDREGKIVVETVNRGEALTRWIAKLQGQKTMSVVGESPEPS